MLRQINIYFEGGSSRCKLTFKRKVRKQSYILVALPALRKSSEDEESSPASAVGAHAYTLYSDSKWVEIASSNNAALDGSDCFHPSVYQEDPGYYDAGRKNPPGDVEGYDRFYLTRPAVEN